MSRITLTFVVSLLLICSAVSLMAQQAVSADSVVPSLVKFSGTLSDIDGKPLSGIAGVNFYLYKEKEGGAPLWMETQNVQADKNGHYSVLLGSASAHGLAAEAFVAGEARWLGVQASGQAEQPRTLLFSVPYALKALDAETLGGKPASFFMSASGSKTGGDAGAGAAAKGGPGQEGPQVEQKNEIVCFSTTACKTGFVPLFSTNGGSAQVTDSMISQNSQGVAIGGTESVSSSASAPAISGTSTGSGWGVYGTASGTSGTSIGVEGVTNSPIAYGVAGSNGGGGIGVYGVSASTGVFGSSFETSGAGVGVGGVAASSSPGAAGVYGQLVMPSSTGPQGAAAGVWGDTGLAWSSGGRVGVLGTADDSAGGIFLNNSHTGLAALYGVSYDSSAYPFAAANVSNGTNCYIDPAGNLNCTGQKHAIVPINGGERRVAMSSIEAPQSWFEDAGSTHLVNGAAIVTLDPDFIQTVNTEMEYHVFLTAYGDCKGLYVTNRTAKSFEVHELGGGPASVGFSYRIMALRRNYENVRFEDHTKDPDPKKMLERLGKAKAASSSGPALVKPAPLAGLGVPVAQLATK